MGFEMTPERPSRPKFVPVHDTNSGLTVYVDPAAVVAVSPNPGGLGSLIIMRSAPALATSLPPAAVVRALERTPDPTGNGGPPR